MVQYIAARAGDHQQGMVGLDVEGEAVAQCLGDLEAIPVAKVRMEARGKIDDPDDASVSTERQFCCV